MTFLQPWLLVALPLMALPVIIHLVNQRRYQTVRWAAMMFLLAANRMSRGFARLRQWLILAFRVLAIGALVFAVSRPLAGGRLVQMAGGRPDATFLLIDRSPSMRQRGLGIEGSKLETGVRRLVRTLQEIGSTRWVLVEGGTNRVRELTSIESLLSASGIEPTSAPSDIPAMLAAVRDYIKTNKIGRSEVWILSDVRENDWDMEGGRWRSLRDAFLEFPQAIRFHLLAYAQPAPGNMALRVTEVVRRDTADGAELLVSLKLTREPGDDARRTIPVQFDIEGARSVVNVEMAGPAHELKNYRIPLERTRKRGWGHVSIPSDVNPADDDFYFTFDRPAARGGGRRRGCPEGAPVAPGRGDLARSGREMQRGDHRARGRRLISLGASGPGSVGSSVAGGNPCRACESVPRSWRADDFFPAARAGQGGVLGRVVDILERRAGRERGRELARRSGSARGHAERRGAAGGRTEREASVRPGGRVHHAGHLARRRAVAGARADRCRRVVLLCDLSLGGRLEPGDRWRGSLRAHPACFGGRCRITRQHAATGRRYKTRRRSGTLAAARGRRGGDLDRLRRSTGASIARASGSWP